MPHNEIDGTVGIVVGPQRDGVALLLVSRPEQGGRHEQRDQSGDSAPFVGIEALVVDALGDRLVQLVGGERGRGVQIDRKRDGHADAGCGEAVMPAELFAEGAANERRQECAEIDADVKDRIGAVAALIARGIEGADLRRYVGLERAAADNECRQGEQEQRLECHHEMAGGHQNAADEHGAALAEHAIGEKAAEDRREIGETGIEAEQLRRERLRVERPEHPFERSLDRPIAEHGFDPAAFDRTRMVDLCLSVLGHLLNRPKANPPAANPSGEGHSDA